MYDECDIFLYNNNFLYNKKLPELGFHYNKSNILSQIDSNMNKMCVYLNIAHSSVSTTNISIYK